jgi:hypothetical protein
MTSRSASAGTNPSAGLRLLRPLLLLRQRAGERRLHVDQRERVGAVGRVLQQVVVGTGAANCGPARAVRRRQPGCDVASGPSGWGKIPQFSPPRPAKSTGHTSRTLGFSLPPREAHPPSVPHFARASPAATRSDPLRWGVIVPESGTHAEKSWSGTRRSTCTSCKTSRKSVDSGRDLTTLRIRIISELDGPSDCSGPNGPPAVGGRSRTGGNSCPVSSLAPPV